MRAVTYAVWPDGAWCSMEEQRELAGMLTCRSDDYAVKEAIGMDEGGYPVFDGD